MLKEVISINNSRNAEINSVFDPLTGLNSVLDRFEFRLDDFPMPIQYLPITLQDNLFIQRLAHCKTIDKFLDEMGADPECRDTDRQVVIQKFIRLRSLHDFCFWAYKFVFIKSKDGGDDIHFSLNRPQRRLVKELEDMRLNNMPIRLILLKARQWGGSTCVQIYMAWIQLVHKKGWNSLIVSHIMVSTNEVKGMFTKLMSQYPNWMLYDSSRDFDDKAKNLVPFEGSQSIDYIPQRGSKIKLGTALSPDSARGGDTAMAHCTEVAFWKKTEGKTPEMIVRSACSGISLAPLTVEIFESTANGTGNFFADEWDRAKNRESDKRALFISWFDIEKYSLPITDINQFAQSLIDSRDNANNNGKYNWMLWERGATLEAINWYINKRKSFTDHADMAAEYPSDDIEAFKHSGQKIFDIYAVNALAQSCTSPRFIGEVRGIANAGKEALKDIRFVADPKGDLSIWEHPETDIEVRDRYLVVVDVGGRSNKSDNSVIYVIDRYWMIYGDKPSTVAQWCGHVRHDILAWKAAQIATYYCNALLVIESNTMETRDKDRDTDGDHTEYILDQIAYNYGNLYAREQSAEDIKISAPLKWGFHTNISTKIAIIDNLIASVLEQDYVERDMGAINEFLTYEKRSNGSFGAISGKHDDRLMTRAIALYISNFKMDIPRVIESKVVTRKRNIGLASTI